MIEDLECILIAAHSFHGSIKVLTVPLVLYEWERSWEGLHAIDMRQLDRT